MESSNEEESIDFSIHTTNSIASTLVSDNLKEIPNAESDALAVSTNTLNRKKSISWLSRRFGSKKIIVRNSAEDLKEPSNQKERDIMVSEDLKEISNIKNDGSTFSANNWNRQTSVALLNKMPGRQKTLDMSSDNDIRESMAPLRERIEILESKMSKGIIISNKVEKSNIDFYKIFTKTNPTIKKILRRIEAVYGADVYLYFKYMLYFLYLNLGIFIVTSGIVILPNFLSYLEIVGSTSFPYLNCTGMKVMKNSDNNIDRIKEAIKGFNGFLYGTYVIDQIASILTFSELYAANFIFSAIIILFFMIYRSSSINGRTFTLDDATFCTKNVLTGYSFYLSDSVDSKLRLIKTVKNLDAYSRHVIKIRKSKAMGFKIYLFRAFMSLFSLGYYSLVIYVLYVVLNFIENSKKLGSYSSWIAILPSITISLSNIIFQRLMLILIKFEMYDATYELVIFMMREVTHMVISIGFYLKDHINNSPKEECWESQFGFDLFLYVIVEFFIKLGDQAFTILKATALKECFTHKTRFSVSSLLLITFTDQIIVWVGLFFCPWISLTVTMKLFILIVITPFMLKHFYHIEPSFYNIYMLKYLCDKCLWGLYLIYIILLGWMLTTVSASSCGVFGIRSCDKQHKILTKIFDIVSHQIPMESSIFLYLSSAAFVFLIVNILCLIISETRNQSKFCKISLKLNERYFKFVVEENKELTKELDAIKLKIHPTDPVDKL